MREYQQQHGINPDAPENAVTILICHGKPRCTARTKKDKVECVWCYKLLSTDFRSTDAVIDDMNRLHG